MIYDEYLRYDHRRGRWLVWQGHRWAPDVDGQIYRMAKEAMRKRLQDAAKIEDQERREKAVKWALGSESRTRLLALLDLAKNEHPVADAGEHWDENPMLLGVPNGVVDLAEGVLRPGRREDRISLNTSVDYDVAATCPRWERFLDEVFGGDTALVGFIHRAIGYSLTGDTTEQCLFLNYGTGANGKSTMLRALQDILGDYAHAMPFSTIEAYQRSSIPNDVAALAGKRMVVASETTDGARINESRVKALTGGDPITARFLHSEFFTFDPEAKFFLAVNHKPVVKDDSRGFWRRMRLVPFTQTFEVDLALAETLKAEGPGILAWAVRGCQAWLEKGLAPPDVVTAATAEYERDSDQLAAFIDEGCVHGDDLSVGGSNFYQRYKEWADHHGLDERRERLTSTKFGGKMTERFKKTRTKAGVVYCGVGLRNQGEVAW